MPDEKEGITFTKFLFYLWWPINVITVIINLKSFIVLAPLYSTPYKEFIKIQCIFTVISLILLLIIINKIQKGQTILANSVFSQNNIGENSLEVNNG